MRRIYLNIFTKRSKGSRTGQGSHFDFKIVAAVLKIVSFTEKEFKFNEK